MLTSNFALKYLPWLVNWKKLHLRKKLTPELFDNYGHKLNKGNIQLVFEVTRDETDKELLVAATEAGVDATWIANRIDAPLWYLDLFASKIEWEDLEVSGLHPEVLSKYRDKLHGKEFTGKILSSEYLMEFKDTVDWRTVSMVYTLDKSHVDLFKDYLDWGVLSRRPTLSVEIVKAYKDRLNLYPVLLVNKLTEKLWYDLAFECVAKRDCRFPDVSLSMFLVGRNQEVYTSIWRREFGGKNVVSWREFLSMRDDKDHHAFIAWSIGSLT